MTSQKTVLYPFISVPKDLNYLDTVRARNEQDRTVQNMFAVSAKKLESIKQAYMRFNVKEYQ